MKNNSIWFDGINFKVSESINSDKRVDVLIIGGGITGLSTAYHLRNSGLKVCLVEKNLVGHGVTSKTTGKLTFLQDNIYSKLKNKALKYYKSQIEAINLVENIIKDNNIKANFEHVDSFLYTEKEKDIMKVKKEGQMLKNFCVPYNEHNSLPIYADCEYAISVCNTAQFHPLKYLIALKEICLKNNIEIYENSCLKSLKRGVQNYICLVNDKKVIAKKVVIASHYPFFLFPYLMPLKTHIEKSYVAAAKIREVSNFSAITISKPIKSIRYYNDYLIYSNKSHNLSTSYNYKNNFNNLLAELKDFNVEADFIWSNHDIMTEDSLPYIGYISNNLLIGTGYNTWGMTNGSLAGKILSDLILNIDNEYASLFDPKRHKKMMNVIKYFPNIFYSSKSFIENKILKNKSWYNGKIKFVKINGKNLAIYIDEFNKKHIIYNMCPHLKCSLIFNEVEKTWDCPCHGSRYDIDGKCIKGPSNKDIGYIPK